jgi:hypothetical protein
LIPVGGKDFKSPIKMVHVDLIILGIPSAGKEFLETVSSTSSWYYSCESGAGGIRTRYLNVADVALSQLSYSPRKWQPSRICLESQS